MDLRLHWLICSVIRILSIKPSPDPVRDGYDFGGWFKEEACTNEWNFTTDVVTGNITLYAKWNKKTGYETPDAPLAKIYPNPTDGVIHLAFESQGAHNVTVSTMNGTVLLRQVVSDEICNMDISGYPAGVYLLIIDNSKYQSVTKVIKN